MLRIIDRGPLLSLKHLPVLSKACHFHRSLATHTNTMKEMSHDVEKGIVVNVKSFYMARGIDILRVYNNAMLYKDCPQRFESKSLTITIDSRLNQYITGKSFPDHIY